MRGILPRPFGLFLENSPMLVAAEGMYIRNITKINNISNLP